MTHQKILQENNFRICKKNPKSFMFQQEKNLKDGWERTGHVWKDIESNRGIVTVYR